MVRKMILLLVILVILVLVVPAATSVPPMAAATDRTHCTCKYMGGGIWCYHCCDYTGCEDLYCGSVCP